MHAVYSMHCFCSFFPIVYQLDWLTAGNQSALCPVFLSERKKTICWSIVQLHLFILARRQVCADNLLLSVDWNFHNPNWNIKRTTCRLQAPSQTIRIIFPPITSSTTICHLYHFLVYFFCGQWQSNSSWMEFSWTLHSCGVCSPGTHRSWLPRGPALLWPSRRPGRMRHRFGPTRRRWAWTSGRWTAAGPSSAAPFPLEDSWSTGCQMPAASQCPWARRSVGPRWVGTTPAAGQRTAGSASGRLSAAAARRTCCSEPAPPCALLHAPQVKKERMISEYGYVPFPEKEFGCIRVTVNVMTPDDC